MKNYHKQSSIRIFLLKKIFKVDIDEIAGSFEKIQSKLEASKNKEKQLEKEKAEAEKRASNLSNNLKYNKESLDSVKKENAEIKSKNNELSRSYSELNSKYKELLSENSKLEEKKSKLEGEKDSLELINNETYKELLKKHEELILNHNNKIDSLIKEKDEIKKERTVLKGTITRLQKKLDSTESELNNEKKLSKEINELIIENKQALSKIENLQKENNAIKGENEQLKNAVDTFDNKQSLGEDNKSLSSDLNKLAKELEEKNKEIQILTEENFRQRDQIREIVDELKEQKRQSYNDIAKLNNLLQEKISYIYDLEKDNKSLKEQILQRDTIRDVEDNQNASIVVEEKQQEKNTADNKIISSKNENSTKKEVIDEQIESRDIIDENITRDLPTIENDATIETVRRIERVLNYQTGDSFLADDFFKQPKEEIAKISRHLEILSRFGGEPLFVCAKCMEPVKISKISRKIGESLFFTHCRHDVDCAWKVSNEVKPIDDVNLNEDEVETISKEFTRYEHLKQLIYNTITQQNKAGDDIDNIELNAKIISQKNRRSWRKYDVAMRWHGIDIVFKLQRSKDYLQDLVSYDQFAKENNYHIIWIFGSDSATRYDYLQEINYQNTLFDNESCVFILDNETEKVCQEKGVLYLKCNWLINGKQWYFTLENSGSNGKLITLNNLFFDNNNYKPYYKESDNSEVENEDDRVKLKSGLYKYRVRALWGLMNPQLGVKTECKYSSIDLDENGRIRAVNADNLNPRIGYLSETGEEIPTSKEPFTQNVYIICTFEQWYLELNTGQRLSEYYDQMIKWNESRVIVKKGKKYGLLDYQGDVILEPKYKTLIPITEAKAKVSDVYGTFFIDINGDIIYEETINLKDGFKKVRHLDKWGILKDGKVVVDFIYDEIGSFRCRLYGFKGNRLIKLVNAPRYNYKIPLKAKFMKYDSGNYEFIVNEILMFLPDKKQSKNIKKSGWAYDVIINNLLKLGDSKDKILVSLAETNVINKKFNHVDLDSDFIIGERLKGVITKIHPNGRRYVLFEDNRESYVTKGQFSNSGVDINDYGRLTEIILEKIDFMDYHETTIWKVINN